MKNLISYDSFDNMSEPLFFGNPMNIQRYDKFQDEFYFKNYLNQVSKFWRPEEFDLSGRDRSDFNNLNEIEVFIFTQNLKYQILLDSVQARGIKYLQEYVTNPELEAAMNAWIFYEQIHSYSYTYIIKNVYSNPGDIFDNIMNDEEIVKRATSVTEKYNKLMNMLPEDTIEDKKKILYLTLNSINILEGIRFYVSFACSYSFAENKKMEGNAKVIKSINRDEALHLALTQRIINTLKTDESQGFVEIAKECEPIVYEMFKDAAEEEKQWAEYLFSKGTIWGLNAEILGQYMEYLTNLRLKGIKMDPIFPKRDNPISWTANWSGDSASKGVQVAPQEVEITSYVVGQYEQDMESTNFKDFKF